MSSPKLTFRISLKDVIYLFPLLEQPLPLLYSLQTAGLLSGSFSLRGVPQFYILRGQGYVCSPLSLTHWEPQVPNWEPGHGKGLGQNSSCTLPSFKLLHSSDLPRLSGAPAVPIL